MSIETQHPDTSVFTQSIRNQLELVRAWPEVAEIFFAPGLISLLVLFEGPPNQAEGREILQFVSEFASNYDNVSVVTNLQEIASNENYYFDVFPTLAGFSEVLSNNLELFPYFVGFDRFGHIRKQRLVSPSLALGIGIRHHVLLEDALDEIARNKGIATQQEPPQMRHRQSMVHSSRICRILNGTLAGLLLHHDTTPEETNAEFSSPAILVCALSGSRNQSSLVRLIDLFLEEYSKRRYGRILLDNRNLLGLSGVMMLRYADALRSTREKIAENSEIVSVPNTKLALISAMESNHATLRNALVKMLSDARFNCRYFSTPDAAWSWLQQT